MTIVDLSTADDGHVGRCGFTHGGRVAVLHGLGMSYTYPVSLFEDRVGQYAMSRLGGNGAMSKHGPPNPLVWIFPNPVPDSQVSKPSAQPMVAFASSSRSSTTASVTSCRRCEGVSCTITVRGFHGVVLGINTGKSAFKRWISSAFDVSDLPGPYQFPWGEASSIFSRRTVHCSGHKGVFLLAPSPKKLDSIPFVRCSLYSTCISPCPYDFEPWLRCGHLSRSHSNDAVGRNKRRRRSGSEKHS